MGGCVIIVISKVTAFEAWNVVPTVMVSKLLSDTVGKVAVESAPVPANVAATVGEAKMYVPTVHSCGS